MMSVPGAIAKIFTLPCSAASVLPQDSYKEILPTGIAIQL